jgi:arabinan endo-1,5-alpha-L-arabinosidase
MRLAWLALLGVVTVSAAQTPAEPGSGMPILHDPSTIVHEGNLYYVFSSGKGIPFFTSPDLQHWTYAGAVYEALPHSVVKYAPANDGLDAWAPDIIKEGDTYYLYYAVSRWGHSASAIGLATNTTLDMKSPDYKWMDRGMVVRSDGQENLNAIDPGVIRTSDGKMWLCYGSYRGSIDLVPLNPKTGLQLKPHSLAYPIALGSEASDIIEHDGWFYLFVNHGSCCQGATSTYHINVGRSRKITGQYVDRRGKSLMDEPGEPFLATEGEHIGPGHFGLIPDADGAGERFSIHYEADTGSNGKPVLAIRKLSWSADGWPVVVPE